MTVPLTTPLEDETIVPMSQTQMIRAVAIGVLVAAAVIWGIWRLSQPSGYDDTECVIQRADHAQGKLETSEMDSTCR